MGPTLAIDFDPHRGGSVSSLEYKHGPLPPTWRSNTGGGGQHVIFASPDPSIGNSAGALGDGVDTRGAGGYILLPPSLHISGKRYTWQPGCSPKQIALAPLPASIAVALSTPNNRGRSVGWANVASSDVAEGARNDTIARFAGMLLRRYVDPRAALELLLAWNACRCHPPLDRDEVVLIVNSIAGRELRRRGESS